MPLGQQIQTDLINHILRADVAGTALAQPAAVYVALLKAYLGPNDSSASEVSETNYARQQVTFSAPDIQGAVASTNIVYFPLAAAAWGEIKALGLYDAATGGKLLSYIELRTPFTVATGQRVRFSPGTILWDFASGGAFVDTLAPSVAINSPNDGQTIGLPLTIQGTATDDIEVQEVYVDVGGSGFAPAIGTWNAATSIFNWALTYGGTAPEGLLTITARAFDIAGNFSDESVTVTVQSDVIVGTASLSGVGRLVANATVVRSGNITLGPADNLALAIANNLDATQFNLLAGTYRLPASLIPKTSQKFVGAGRGQTILKGSVALTSFTVSGSAWYAALSITQQALAGTGPALSRFAEEVFYDGRRLQRAGTTAVLVGQYFIDYAAARVYIGSTPTGHTVEVSKVSSAFSGSAATVRIQGMSIAQFATPASGNTGAVSARNASGWIVQDVDVSDNHGRGIDCGISTVVSNCVVARNGHWGVALATGATLQTSSLDRNNALNFDPNWEGGSVLIPSAASGAQVLTSPILNGSGVGVEVGPNAKNYVVHANTIEGNSWEGVRVNHAYEGIVRNNTVKANGLGITSANGSGSAIYIWNSGSSTSGGGVGFIGVEVHGNITGPSGGAITLHEGPSLVSASDGAHIVKNVNVHDNTMNLSIGRQVGGWNSAQVISPPTNLRSSNITQVAATLAWNASPSIGVTGYGIYRDGVKQGADVAGLTSVQSGLVAGTNYRFSVDATNGTTRSIEAALNVLTLADVVTTTGFRVVNGGGGYQATVKYADPALHGVGKAMGGGDTGGHNYSSDYGKTWQNRNYGLGSNNDRRGICALEWSKVTANKIYSLWGKGSQGGLQYSLNNGETWTQATVPSNFVCETGGSVFPRANGNLIALAEPNVYAGTKNGVFRSTNSGANFSTLLVTGDVRGVAVDPQNTSTLYVALNSGGLRKITNANGTPNVTTLGSLSSPQEVFGYLDSVYVAAGTQGVYKIVGGVLTNITNNLPTGAGQGGAITTSAIVAFTDASGNRCLMAGCTNPKAGSTANWNEHVYISRNNGATWTPLFDSPAKVINDESGPNVPVRPNWILTSDIAQANVIGWLGASDNFNISGISVYPGDSNYVLMSGKRGQWRSANLAASIPIAYPVFQGLGAAIEHAVDTFSNGNILIADSDWDEVDIDRATDPPKVHQNEALSALSTDGFACCVNQDNDRAYIGGGNSAGDTNGTVIYNTDMFGTPNSWTDASYPSGTKVVGMLAFVDGTTEILLTGATDGIRRRSGTSWSLVEGTSSAVLQSGGHVGTSFARRPGSSYIYYYDCAKVWRSTNKGTSWTAVWTLAAGAGDAFLALDPTTETLYVSDGSNAYRVANAHTESSYSTAAVNLNVAGGNAGPLATNPANGGLYVSEKYQGGTTELWYAASPQTGTPSFARMADTAYKGGCGYINSMKVAPDGWVIVCTQGMSGWMGKPVGVSSYRVAATADIVCAPSSPGDDCRGSDTYLLVKNDATVDALIIPGDLQYEAGSLSNFNTEYSRDWGTSPVRNKTYPVPGNHEYNTSNANGYYDYWNGSGVTTKNAPNGAGNRTKGYYAFDIGPYWRGVALNANLDLGVGGTQAAFAIAEANAAVAAGKNVIAYWHQARFTNSNGASGGHDDDVTTRYLWDAIEQARPKIGIIVVGHVHHYERWKRVRQQNLTTSGLPVADTTIGMRQFMVGTGGHNQDTIVNKYGTGGSVTPGLIEATFGDTGINNYGILLLDLFQRSYSWQFKDLAGTIQDSGTETGNW